MTREQRVEVKDIVKRFNNLPLESQKFFIDLLMVHTKNKNARSTNSNTARVHRVVKRKDKAPRGGAVKTRSTKSRKKV
jgi:hypothetical protein